MNLTIKNIHEQLIILNKYYNKSNISSDIIQQTVKRYYYLLKDIDLNTFIKICEQWKKEIHSGPPTPDDILKRCKALKAGFDFKESVGRPDNLFNPLDLYCCHEHYFKKLEIIQCVISINLCMQATLEQLHWECKKINGLKNLKDLAEYTRLTFGYVLCHWHKDLANACKRPGDIDDIRCKMMIKYHS